MALPNAEDAAKDVGTLYHANACGCVPEEPSNPEIKARRQSRSAMYSLCRDVSRLSKAGCVAVAHSANLVGIFRRHDIGVDGRLLLVEESSQLGQPLQP